LTVHAVFLPIIETAMSKQFSSPIMTIWHCHLWKVYAERGLKVHYFSLGFNYTVQFYVKNFSIIYSLVWTLEFSSL